MMLSLTLAATFVAGRSRVGDVRVDSAATRVRVVTTRPPVRGRSPDSAWATGSTVHPTPRATISRSTSG